MSSSVSVLAPNGRRQTVKCTANTTIMQIIEEVCRKQGYKPEDFDIKHHNKVLDTTITFRFSGLPNNAQLELATATKTRLDSEVILAINLESGERIMGNFLPDETLWNILLKLCPNDITPDRNPVVIYMRNEIYGNKLETTTLRNLGLRGGRAMVRLVHRTPDELKTQANVSAPLPAKLVEEKPYHRVLKTETPSPDVSLASVEDNENIQKSKCFQKKAEVDILKLAREKRKLSFGSKPAEPESHVVKTRPKIEADKSVEMEPMEIDQNQEPRSIIASQKSEESNLEDFVFLGERNAMLFSLESAQSIPVEDLPDDFFELTIDDAKKILGDVRRRRHELENGTLMTSSMRNLEESKKQLRQLNRYKQSVIRVQFPDRTILQGTFKPAETIKDVNDFVSNYLEDKTCQFYLYTTPPKCILSQEDRLMEIGCVPGALLHLGTDSLNKNEIRLKAELKDKFTTNSVASLAASKMRKESTRSDYVENYNMDQDESMDTLTDVNTPGPSSQPTSYERKIIKSTEKVPKWFKPNK